MLHKIAALVRRCYTKQVIGLRVSYEVPEQGYTEPATIVVQSFQLQRRLFRLKLPGTTTLFVEKVPSWAEAQAVIFGETEWRSEAPDKLHKTSRLGWLPAREIDRILAEA